MNARRRLLRIVDMAYGLFCRLLLFRVSAQRAHKLAIGQLGWLERWQLPTAMAKRLRAWLMPVQTQEVGGAKLSARLILAAGLVKGRGFTSEDEALRAVVHRRENIMPGWRMMPALVGPIEFGSFTRHPRMGNAGTTLWRERDTQSTQNRIGLRNPGARAAAAFLGARIEQLPGEFGINIAVSPGVSDLAQQQGETLEALIFFLDAGLRPSWFTLNISCPNTEDDPSGHQLEAGARSLCAAFVAELRKRNLEIPLWVKVSPGLAAAQYHMLMRIFAEVGVRAVIATNTLAKPSPVDSAVNAGIGGGALRDSALLAVEELQIAKDRLGCAMDIIGCGGVMDGESFYQYSQCGAVAAQYWSALVFRGPFAAALIENELANHEHRYEAIHRERLA
ncbi:MAG: hypothetical protein OXE46_13575 [Chloroflexi bacterium]|nr:hypothetical protein [Chloroflexota bacterium]